MYHAQSRRETNRDDKHLTLRRQPLPVSAHDLLDIGSCIPHNKKRHFSRQRVHPHQQAPAGKSKRQGAEMNGHRRPWHRSRGARRTQPADRQMPSQRAAPRPLMLRRLPMLRHLRCITERCQRLISDVDRSNEPRRRQVGSSRTHATCRPSTRM